MSCGYGMCDLWLRHVFILCCAMYHRQPMVSCHVECCVRLRAVGYASGSLSCDVSWSQLVWDDMQLVVFDGSSSRWIGSRASLLRAKW